MKKAKLNAWLFSFSLWKAACIVNAGNHESNQGRSIGPATDLYKNTARVMSVTQTSPSPIWPICAV
jgi:DNA repair exonuclease SbcCD nuclease subunit